MYTNPINILVVDDEPCICSSIREFLGVHEDLNVDTVNSTVDARTALGHQRYDAIICDYQMPDEDGISFLRWLRSRGDSIPFLLFTEKGREEVTITALNCGADSYLQKGSRISSLCAEMDKRIRTLVERDRELRKMKDRARMFQTLMNQTKEAMYLHELSGKIIEVNETAVRDSGYT
ncbi:MAG: response regulator, partial [Methanomassiliicoccales archaeon]|nr:response regulator [Methanomassiliicoccales archaeon]